tara:strand:- start:4 stop:1446 length:1443 start_codon:yes stop_codon:yes gene_type:complete
MEKIKNYINGKLIGPRGGVYLKNFNPSTGKVYSLLPNSDKDDFLLALKGAKKAFLSWSKKSKKYRYNILMNIAKELDKNSDNLALAESKDNGKPLWLTKEMDIPRCAENIRFFATASLHFDSKLHTMDGLAINYTLREPIGIVGCISPWNLPLYLLTWKIAPALAAGNVVIAKPSEITPYTAYLFSKICIKAGVPDGVISILHGTGSGVGEEIVKHKNVPVISFTGGTKTGKKINELCAKNFKKVSLEMGGKNPTIIFSDCDFNKALETSVRAAFLNQGQICLCGSRIFVEKGLYPKFKAVFVKKVKGLVVGNPSSKKSFLGAMVSKEHMEKVLSYIDLAKKEGGEILCGGKRIFLKGKLKEGYYISPTVIGGLNHLCKTNQEEIFGPVVSIVPFDSEEDVVKMANSTNYGLSASVFTENLSRGHRVSEKIKSGVVWVNTWLLRDLRIPFGGMKDSGVGREGGFDSLRFFTETKNVCVKI